MLDDQVHIEKMYLLIRNNDRWLHTMIGFILLSEMVFSTVFIFMKQ